MEQGGKDVNGRCTEDRDAHPIILVFSNKMKGSGAPDKAARYADMFSALGAEPRLHILRLLLAAHPEGLVAGEIQSELGIPASTLSHHLDKLKNEDLVAVRREGTYLRYRANAEALRELLSFLYAECCTRSKVIRAEELSAQGRKREG